MDNKETRSLPLPNDGEGRNVSGYAANFREYDMGSFRERIERSAFDNLDAYDIHALYNHDYDKVLARRNKGKGTLELTTDETGLKFGFELPDTATGNEVRTLVGRGDVDQASWAFTVKSEEWLDVRSEKPLRVIKEVGEIYDISLTPRGANPTTSVALRSLEAAQQEYKEPELAAPVIETKPENVENVENTEERAANFVDASAVQGKLSKSEERDLAKFNIVKAINEARNGKLTGVEAEVNQEGINEKRKLNQDYRDSHAVNLPEFLFKRTQTAGGATTGSDLVFTEPGRYVDFLYPNTPMLNLCSVADNLVGNVDFPKQTSSYSLNWQTETGTDSAQDINFDKVTMSPKRAVITASMSNQLLRQEYSRGIEQRIIGQLNLSFNKGLENAVLNGTGASNQPSGIYTELAGQALTLGAISFDDLVDMEAALAAADALDGRLAYVTHPNVVAKLKKTKVDAGSGRFLVEGMLDPVKTANGYNIYNTTLSKKTAGSPDTYGILFGNFSDVQIGFWGGATLMVDPYTNMKSSIVEVYVERFMDVAVLRDASFALATDVTI
jgi:HK97 family phage major capsid protein/HK97 family phage prohead protease